MTTEFGHYRAAQAQLDRIAELMGLEEPLRELLRSQNQTEWVIISTGMFMSYLFEPEFGVVDLHNDAVHALGSLDTAVTLTTPDDIGALTAT